MKTKINKNKKDWLILQPIFCYIKIKEKYTRIFKKIDKPAPDFGKYEDPKIYLL